MRQFADVSISPWANPYSNSDSNTGRNFYATATVPQPQTLYRRVVLPDPLTVPDASAQYRVHDDEDEDEDDHPGML